MQILYGTTMLAVFVVCIALFTTARRLLRASPLQSGELGLPRFERYADSSEESPDLHWQPYSSDGDVENDGTLPISTEAYIGEIKAAGHQTSENFDRSAAAEDTYESDFTIEAPLANQPSQEEPLSGEILQARRATTPAYTYFLEVLLIGVSAAVLVRTQRSTSRYCLEQASRGRVA
jgi:hypothetical protein